MPYQDSPPKKRMGKFAIIAGAIVALMIVTVFVGMNLQHAQTLREQQSGQVKPENKPLTEKDLGKSPAK